LPYPRAEELVRVSTVMTAEKGAERNCSLSISKTITAGPS
jgi:hypothetical protein